MLTINERISLLMKELPYTQAEFAERIHLTQSYISRIAAGAKTPSDRTIFDICREFNVSEAWLRDGEGEMFVTRSRNQEIAMMVHSILSDEDESFRKRLIHSLCALSIEEWKVLEKIAKGLLPSD